MSHHNTCYRSEHYDLWFDNGFLLYGMSLILNSLPASYFRKKHVFCKRRLSTVWQILIFLRG